MLPYAKFRTFGDLIFSAGHLGVEADGSVSSSFRRQMELALDALRTGLESEGSSLESVLKANVFVVNRADIADMNEIYASYFSEPWPVRSTIVTELTRPELLFEIEVVAQRIDG